MTRTGWVALAGVAVLLAAAFPLVLRSYEAKGGLQVTGSEEAPKGYGLIVRMSSIDPEADQFTARLDFDPVSLIGLLDGVDRLTRAMRIAVSSLDGAHEFRYPVGDQLTAQTATFGVTIDVVVFLWTLLVTWIATLLLAWAWGLRSTAAILGGTRPQ